MTDQELNSALAYAARLAATRGSDVPEFVEVFARLEALALDRQKAEDTMSRARRLAGVH